MSRSIVWTIFVKELLDTLRDKRTLIAMIGVPILLYPTLVLIMGELTVTQSAKIAATQSRIAIVSSEAETISSWFSESEQIVLHDIENAEPALLTGDLDAILRVSGSLREVMTDRGTLQISIEFDMTEGASRLALERIQDVLEERETVIMQDRLSSQSLPESFADPFDIDVDAVEEDTKRAGFFLGSILPVIVVLMMALGGFYPAVDLTAGEKERGTFETLLSTPASKLDILAGKFGAVLTLSVITGLLNVMSSGLTIWIYLIQLSKVGGDEIANLGDQLLSIPPGRILLMILMILPLAFIMASLMMTVAVFARTFKDAQNYLTPRLGSYRT